MQFVANVAGRMWSGLEAYTLSVTETRTLDIAIAKKLRAALTGEAHLRGLALVPCLRFVASPAL